MGEPIPVSEQMCQCFLCTGGWGYPDRMLTDWGHKQGHNNQNTR